METTNRLFYLLSTLSSNTNLNVLLQICSTNESLFSFYFGLPKN